MNRLLLMVAVVLCACGHAMSAQSGAEDSTESREAQAAAHEAQAAAHDEVTPDRELARVARASLTREDPEAGPPAAAALAKRHGGWVASMEAHSVTIGVPGTELDAVLVELPTLGKVTERHFAARDATAAHRDLSARIENLKRERERYLALLERADTISDAASVEREVERLTTQLELLQAQLQALTEHVQDAAVSLEFSRELRPGPVGYVFYALYAGAKWLFVRD